jgi:ubiquinone/menaquinone biosynthesis C-methylase UbiE
MTTAPQFWNRVAERYAASTISNVEAYEHTLTRTRAHLGPGDRVLEIGCGTASTAIRLAPSVATYIATDYAAEMVRIGREKLARGGPPNLQILRAGPGDGALPDGPFDAVLAFSLLHLLPDLPAALAEMRGLLRPGGLLISKTPCLSGPWNALRPVLGVMRLAGKAPPSVRFLSPARLERAMTAAGFVLVEAADHNTRPVRRFVVAQRP